MYMYIYLKHLETAHVFANIRMCIYIYIYIYLFIYLVIYLLYLFIYWNNVFRLPHPVFSSILYT